MTSGRCYVLGMRWVACLAVFAPLSLAGCPTSSGGECNLDRDCESGEVCGRDSACASPSSLREVKITWTVSGAPPTMASCQLKPDLFLSFSGSGPADTIGYAPVPCHIGQFNIDKLPVRFTTVELGIEGGASTVKAITGATVAFDLR